MWGGGESGKKQTPTVPLRNITRKKKKKDLILNWVQCHNCMMNTSEKDGREIGSVAFPSATVQAASTADGDAAVFTPHIQPQLTSASSLHKEKKTNNPCTAAWVRHSGLTKAPKQTNNPPPQTMSHLSWCHPPCPFRLPDRTTLERSL